MQAMQATHFYMMAARVEEKLRENLSEPEFDNEKGRKSGYLRFAPNSEEKPFFSSLRAALKWAGIAYDPTRTYALYFSSVTPDKGWDYPTTTTKMLVSSGAGGVQVDLPYTEDVDGERFAAPPS